MIRISSEKRQEIFKAALPSDEESYAAFRLRLTPVTKSLNTLGVRGRATLTYGQRCRPRLTPIAKSLNTLHLSGSAGPLFKQQPL
jgi:hypothetical protein